MLSQPLDFIFIGILALVVLAWYKSAKTIVSLLMVVAIAIAFAYWWGARV